MGNSAGKSSDEALREAVQMLLEVPMVGPAAAAARAAAAVGDGDGLSSEEEHARAVAEAGEEAAAVVREEEEAVWMGVFGCAIEEDEFFEVFSASDATAMRLRQPGNLKLLAREALSNISRFMESRQTSPHMVTVNASIRVLTRVLPALLSSPELRSWCWARRTLPQLLSYLRNNEEHSPPRNGQDVRQQQQQQGRRQEQTPRGRFPTPEPIDAEPAPLPDTTSPPSPTELDDGVASSGSGVSTGGAGAGGGGISSRGGVNCRPYGGSGDGDDGEGDGGKGGDSGSEGGGGRDGGRGGAGDDFPVCFASVALHAATSLLSFPGFCVDDEAMEWNDYYTPIPDLHYGIKEAAIIWAPGVAVTEHNMRQVSSFDSNRVETLRLLATLLSLPLFLDTPSPRTPTIPPQAPPPRRRRWPSGAPPPSIPGKPLPNPTAALAASRHLQFSSELFYSLLNLAVVSRAVPGGEAAGRAGGGGGQGVMRWFGLGGGGTGGAAGPRAEAEGGAQSLAEWALQMLALLLRHGRPYDELLKQRGVDLAASGAAPVFGSVPRPVEFSAERARGYNCFRRCVFVVHSDDDLGAIALGLLRHMDDSRLRRTRPQGSLSLLSIHQETLMIFAAFVHENPRFVPRLAASEELVRGTAVCVCHFLRGAVTATIEAAEQQQQQQQQQQQRDADADGEAADAMEGGNTEIQNRRNPHGEEVGLLVLLSRLLLTLSDNERFVAMLVDMLAAGGGAGGRGAEFAAPDLGDAPGTTMIEVVLSLCVYALARAGTGGAVVAPALAAVARNLCPFLTRGMRRQTAESLLDALEVYLVGGGSDGGLVEEEGGDGGATAANPSSWAVASLLLEGLAAAAVFHHEEQAELVKAMIGRSRDNPTFLGKQQQQQQQQQQQRSDDAGGGQGAAGQETRPWAGGGVLRWLAARGGMLEGGMEGGDGDGDGGGVVESWSREASAKEAEALTSEQFWFESRVPSLPWEGWAMRRVLWPLLSLVTAPPPSTTAPGTPGPPGSPELERAAAVRALASSARRKVLRPAGLCPPWDEEDDGDGDLRARGAEDGNGAYAQRGAAAVGGAAGYLTSSTPPDTTAAAAAAAPGRSNSRASRGTGVSGVSLVGEDGRRLPPPPGTPGPPPGGGVVPPEATASGRAGVGGGGVGAGREKEGGGGEVEVLTRVAAVEEPWQSIYLWSQLFVKTTADLRLFDSREVRLFEIIEGETGDGNQRHGNGDDDMGTEVDEEFYQESFFPGEGGDGDSPSPPRSEPARGGSVFGGRRSSGGSGSDGGARSSPTAAVAGVPEDNHGDDSFV